MNRNDECPCHGCTTETGRGPGCHNKDCPHGWYEWDQKHKDARRAESKARLGANMAEEIEVKRYRAIKKAARRNRR